MVSVIPNAFPFPCLGLDREGQDKTDGREGKEREIITRRQGGQGQGSYKVTEGQGTARARRWQGRGREGLLGLLDGVGASCSAFLCRIVFSSLSMAHMKSPRANLNGRRMISSSLRSCVGCHRYGIALRTGRCSGPGLEHNNTAYQQVEFADVTTELSIEEGLLKDFGVEDSSSSNLVLMHGTTLCRAAAHIILHLGSPPAQHQA
jgi:hypothetical protein